jgi:hypothetical protein
MGKLEGKVALVTGEEQNAPVVILDHWLDQRARQVERAVENHAPDQLPIRVGGFGERFVRPDRGIVDQNVDPAELRQRLGGQRLDLGLFADVGEDGDGLDPEVPGLARHGLSLLPIGARVDHNMRTFSGQLQHRRTTDIAPDPVGDGAISARGSGRTHLSAAKMGLIGMARGLASEFAPHNIRVNVVSPGSIDTRRDHPEWYQGRVPDASGGPLGRQGSVDEIAATCLFLVSEDGGFITGQTLHVNGGAHYY